MIQLISSFLFVIAFSFLSHAQAATPGNTELAPSGAAPIEGMCAACEHGTTEGYSLSNHATDAETAALLSRGDAKYRAQQVKGSESAD